MKEFFIGTAGWTIPSEFSEHFPPEGTHLARYAQIFNAVEINSSFYKHHQAKTYSRWSRCTPPHFRFSVKLSKEVTHGSRLNIPQETLEEILKPIMELEEKFGALLVQIPPSLAFDGPTAENFFSDLRRITSVPVAFEPRHASWLSGSAQRVLREARISKVIADPELVLAENPRSFLNGDLVYYRLHGAPEVYRSPYSEEQLREIRKDLEDYSKDFSRVWCIFDNTALGWATANARTLQQMTTD